MAGVLATMFVPAPALFGQDAAPSGHALPTAVEGAPPDPDALIVTPDIAAVLNQNYPRSVEDLRLLERQVGRVLEKVVPATVGIQIGASAGSGVIISPDGLVLTAGHVSGEPDQNAFLIMPDGRRVRGRTLGLNRGIDSGLMKIVEKGPWPYVEMAPSKALQPGQWVIATGHPGGYSRDRSPPVRLGRILYASDEVICTDCTLVGGDSGGPLFNMKGEVIGIHSRIGRSLTSNFHVPIGTYRDTWDRLASGEMWGGRMPTDERGQVRPYLGLHLSGFGTPATVAQVIPGTPAAQAGIQVNDVILKFAGAEIASPDGFVHELWGTRPGQRVDVEIKRGDEKLTLRLVVGGLARALPGSPEYVPREPKREAGRSEEQQPPPDESAEPDRSDGSGEPEPEAPRDLPPAEEPDDNAQPHNPPGKTPPQESADPEPGDSPPASQPDSAPATGSRSGIERLRELGIELDPVALRCVVSNVATDSPADLGGVRAGDVIESVGGKETARVADLAATASRGDGATADELAMSILRNGRVIGLVVKAPRD